MRVQNIWLLGLLTIIVICGIRIFVYRVPIQKKATGYTIKPSDTGNETSSYTQCNQFSSVEYMSYPTYTSFDKPNNKYGVYIYAEEDRFFKLAERLVNSNGGDWGYVLIPYNVKDRNYDKWKNVFENLNRRHLIPIIQLWDIDTTKYKSDTRESAIFLNSFLWPVKERYISVYNEPNDDKFWKGEADPKSYAKILNYTLEIFKDENSNFFILNGALNASAPNINGYIDPKRFMHLMNQEIPGIFEKLDGWASHSYPQPNFSGSPYDTGLWSVRAYEDELTYLKTTLGVKKELPVFITETGWAHAEGASYNNAYFNAQTVAKNYETAFREVWLKDKKVRAVTPFTILYNPPYDHFSWINSDGVPYEQYEVIKSMKKTKGEPSSLQIKKMQISNCQK